MGAPVLGICSSMNFLIVWAVSYHIGESDRFGNEVAKAVETGRSRQETRGREQAMVAWSKSGCLRGLLTLVLALSGASFGRALSHANNHDHHAVRGRKRNRCRRAHDRAVASGRAGP